MIKTFLQWMLYLFLSLLAIFAWFGLAVGLIWLAETYVHWLVAAFVAIFFFTATICAGPILGEVTAGRGPRG